VGYGSLEWGLPQSFVPCSFYLLWPQHLLRFPTPKLKFSSTRQRAEGVDAAKVIYPFILEFGAPKTWTWIIALLHCREKPGRFDQWRYAFRPSFRRKGPP
jgi:hypothetical protein